MTSPKKKCSNPGNCHKAFAKKAGKEGCKTPCKPEDSGCCPPKSDAPKQGGCCGPKGGCK